VSFYYNRAGEPIDLDTWAELFVADRKVADDMVDGVRVSTVFIGLDLGVGEPQLFETMIFGGVLDGCCWRYPTEAAAKVGHGQAMALVALETEATT